MLMFSTSGRMMDIITVRQLYKTYRIPDTDAGVRRFSFKSPAKSVVALSNISFTINSGEIVGLIGPNGAGKSTIIKVLSGILTPSSGDISVLGYDPSKRNREFLNDIGVMMGQRSMLFFDLPVEDSFSFYSRIYKKVSEHYRERLNTLVKKIDLYPYLKVPVRKLSLGQRMKAELILSLIHNPRVLFLDEPTIGLDALSKREILSFIKELNASEGNIVMLTSHDLNDVDMLSDKLLLIDKGFLQYFGDMSSIDDRSDYRIVDVHQPVSNVAYATLQSYCYNIETHNSSGLRLLVANEHLNTCIDVLRDSQVDDISINRPNLEFVLSRMRSRNL